LLREGCRGDVATPPVSAGDRARQPRSATRRPGHFSEFKRDLTFGDIGFLREASGLPVVVKGLLNVEDARQSLAAGAAVIWVSNHGGRQLDGVRGGRPGAGHRGQRRPPRHRCVQGA
jgi:hypothetical protein